jgi:hypothetical protein
MGQKIEKQGHLGKTDGPAGTGGDAKDASTRRLIFWLVLLTPIMALHSYSTPVNYTAFQACEPGMAVLPMIPLLCGLVEDGRFVLCIVTICRV